MYFCALFKRVGFINCCCSSVVEHFLGKEEVVSSSLINSSRKQMQSIGLHLLLLCSRLWLELTTSKVLLFKGGFRWIVNIIPTGA